MTKELGRPQLCYFEGTVSALVRQPRLLYLVDGHASPGVSGGPVWTALYRGDPPMIIGVVSAFAHDEIASFPGFCIFEPINSLVAMLESESGTTVDKEP